jgi:putative phosphoribosyl transferase
MRDRFADRADAGRLLGKALQALKLADPAVVGLYTPRVFGAVGAHYRDFEQTTDDEVVAAMREFQRKR